MSEVILEFNNAILYHEDDPYYKNMKLKDFKTSLLEIQTVTETYLRTLEKVSVGLSVFQKDSTWKTRSDQESPFRSYMGFVFLGYKPYELCWSLDKEIDELYSKIKEQRYNYLDLMRTGSLQFTKTSYADFEIKMKNPETLSQMEIQALINHYLYQAEEVLQEMPTPLSIVHKKEAWEKKLDSFVLSALPYNTQSFFNKISSKNEKVKDSRKLLINALKDYQSFAKEEVAFVH